MDSCYSAAEVSHDRDQVRCAITEVTGNWHYRNTEVREATIIH